MMSKSEIIKNLHKQWLLAKEQLKLRCEECHKDDVAQKLSICAMFKGDENIPELVNLFKSSRGMEFCLAANFPTLAVLRMFRSYAPERYGVYIDAGRIELENPGNVVFIGETEATVYCNTCSRHEITAMHGASVSVIASGWAVIHTQSGIGATIKRRAIDNAMILC